MKSDRLFCPLLLLLLSSAFAAVAQSNDGTPYYFGTLAGTAGGPGIVDGPAFDARFNNPRDLGFDNAGNLYILDSNNYTIRKVTPTGVVTTFAGTAGARGLTDGIGPAARFDTPFHLTVDATGNVYVADTNSIRKISPEGAVTTWVGTAGKIGYVGGLVADRAGNIYVVDSGVPEASNSIRRITPAGAISTLVDSDARIKHPGGLAIDGADNLYVTNTTGNTVLKITPAGLISTLAGTTGASGSVDGTGPNARFVGPTGVTTDSAGNVYVNDACTLRKITPTGIVTTLAGSTGIGGSTDGIGSNARFTGGGGLTVNRNGDIYLADVGNHTIRRITPVGAVTTFAGMAGPAGSADGRSAAARFNSPSSVAVDGSRNLYIADAGNNTIRRATPSGVVTTLAGTAGLAGTADGTGPEARFDYPYSLAVDRTGHVYVSDIRNHTIRKITPAGVVSTLAGLAGTPGWSDGTGSGARFNMPHGLAVDDAGNVYVADANSTVRKIAPSGTVTTLAGTAGIRGRTDGSGANARFYQPDKVAVDGIGNIYVTDYFNSSIRKITPDGAVTTPVDNAGGTAEAIAIDNVGNFFIADEYNNTIRKITPAGVATTLAGAELLVGSEDGVGIGAHFHYPRGLAVDTDGTLYVADTANHKIRKGQLAGPPTISTQPLSQIVTAGTGVQFSVTAGGVPDPKYQWYFNGSAFDGATSNTLSFTNARSSDAGDYSVVVTNPLGSVTSNKATLIVSAAPAPTPTPAPSGGSGGGSISAWFVLVLFALLAILRPAKRSSLQ